ncbi:MAG TPA: FlgO family outer membrane protein, partial [Gemmatimonadales bacterium]|nr:FlgO family outer membrane protein [Gemmatimonadales bacterium]
MYLFRLVTLAALSGALTVPLAAQGIPRNAQRTSVTMAPRFMVANPFAFAPGDSAPAVAIGSGVREEMKGVVGRDFQVIEQQQMNDALTQYGYPKDAILSPALASTLAKNIQARYIVTSTLAKGQRGYTVTARIHGVNDDAGNVVTVAQQQGENPQGFGKRVAEALEPMVESADEAKACIDQRTTKPDKAAESAQKAIKAVPDHGLAHYCLALLAQDKKAPRGEIVKHLQASAKGDPLSLPVWTALATQYQQANDTANTLVAFKQMLRVAPTNQKLREELFKYFLQSGHPETALEVADEGLKIDPYNADLYDLKSNACLFLSNFKCAVDALETMYATDSTKADTLFFTKISAAAAEGEQPDTVRLLKWSQIGVRKYPDNPTLLGYLNRAYTMTGQVDSVVAVTNRLIAKDTTAIVPALEAAQALINAPPAAGAVATTTDTANRGGAPTDTTAAASPSRAKEALPFLEFAMKYGDPQAKENAAALLYSAGAKLLQSQPQDLAGAAELLRLAVQNANPSGKVGPAANYL